MKNEGLTLNVIPGLSQKVVASAHALSEMLGRYRGLFMKGRGMGRTLQALIDEINYRDYISTLYKTPEASFRRLENLDGFVDSLIYYESTEESPFDPQCFFRKSIGF